MAYRSFEQVMGRNSRARKKTVAVAAAQDAHVLEAVFAVEDEGLADYRLAGDPEQIRRIAAELGREVDPGRIVPAPEQDQAAAAAVALVRASDADFLMKGRLETATLMRAVLDPVRGIRGAGTMSHVALLEVPAYHKLLAVTDGGMLPHPSLEQKWAILHNALELFRRLGYDRPKVAVLAASETVNPRQPETAEAAAIRGQAASGLFGNCVVEGPISLDLALSAEAAAIKGYHSPVAGDADILLAPDLACGNMLTKSLLLMGGAKMAGCIVGAKAPIVLTSRGATAEEKRLSILLAAATAGEDVQ